MTADTRFGAGRSRQSPYPLGPDVEERASRDDRPADLVPGCVGAFGCCSQLCSFAVPDPDALCEAEGQICVPFYAEGKAPPGYELIGACVLP